MKRLHRDFYSVDFFWIITFLAFTLLYYKIAILNETVTTSEWHHASWYAFHCVRTDHLFFQKFKVFEAYSFGFKCFLIARKGEPKNMSSTNSISFCELLRFLSWLFYFSLKIVLLTTSLRYFLTNFVISIKHKSVTEKWLGVSTIIMTYDR